MEPFKVGTKKLRKKKLRFKTILPASAQFGKNTQTPTTATDKIAEIKMNLIFFIILPI
jgi:hypothetical protein